MKKASADITCPRCGKVLRGAGGSVGGGAFFHTAECPGPAVASAKEGSPQMLMDPEAASVLEQNTLLRVALAASQAENETTLRQHGDLCGEIEELRRALAVSQGEVERLKREVNTLNSQRETAVTREQEFRGLHVVARGDLELARGLLFDAEASLAGVVEWAAKNFQPMQHAAELVTRLRAFLAPPTPTASPEPDRDPEVTVTNQGETK